MSVITLNILVRVCSKLINLNIKYIFFVHIKHFFLLLFQNVLLILLECSALEMVPKEVM